MGDDDQVVSPLVTRKIQVAPKVKITIPWMELVAAVNSVRLVRKELLRIPLAGIRYFTDSSVILGMLRMKSGRFTKFLGARVSGVKVNSNIEEEWLWPIWIAIPQTWFIAGNPTWLYRLPQSQLIMYSLLLGVLLSCEKLKKF
jgi:hypothetical protein